MKQVSSAEIELFITRLVYSVDVHALTSKHGQAVAEGVEILVSTRHYASLTALLEKQGGKLSVKVNGVDVELVLGLNLFPSAFALARKK